MLKRYYVKNDDFQILHTFAQTPLKLLNYQVYQYKGLINGFLMIYNIFYSLGKKLIHTL